VSPYQPFAALAALQRHGVRFVVIGGFGARIWGSPTMTNDTDICYDRSEDNLERLAGALSELGARLRGVAEEVPFLMDAATLGKGRDFTFDTAAGPLDVLGAPAGTSGFEELSANAVDFELGDGLVVAVAHIDDLIRLKRAAGRPKDRIELEVLAAVREEIEAGDHLG
jgi:hypothetical protein